jgi:hypothetical protein
MKESGAPGGIRTPDLLVRSQTLYPTELRARRFSCPVFKSLQQGWISFNFRFRPWNQVTDFSSRECAIGCIQELKVAASS